MTDSVDVDLYEECEEQHQPEGTTTTTTTTSSGYFLVALEKLLSRSHMHSAKMSSIKYQSKSVDDLRTRRRHRQEQQRAETSDDTNVSNTTRTESDLSGIGRDNQFECIDDRFSDDEDNDDKYEARHQRCRSAPTSPTQIFDKELAAFIQCDQQQQLISDSFIYNMDLSDTCETSQQPQSRAALLFDEDYSPDDDNYELPVSIIHSSLISNCLTITEENEEELEQLQRDDDEEEQQRQRHLCQLNDGSIPTIILHDDDDRADLLENGQNEHLTTMNSRLPLIVTETHHQDDERLSTIYESPSPQPQIEEENEDDDDAYDKLIVYDIAKAESSPNIHASISSSSSPSHRSPIIDRARVRSCFTNASFDICPKFTNVLSASRLCGTTTMINAKVYKPSLSPTSFTSSLSSPVINAPILPSRQTFNALSYQQESQYSPSRSSPMSISVPMLLLTNEQSTSNIDSNNRMPSEHVKKMRVIQSSSSSLSDFIMPTPSSTPQDTIYYQQVPSVHHSLTDCSSAHYTQCAPPLLLDEDRLPPTKSSDDSPRRRSINRRILTNGLLLSHCSSNPTHRRAQPPLTFTHHHHHYQTKTKSEEKLSSSSSPSTPDSSSSSSSSSSSTSTPGDKLMSRSDFVLQHQQNMPQQRKASSLKNVYVTSPRQPPKILYPIDFEMHHNNEQWLRQQSSSSHQTKVPTSDSGIVIDTAGMGPTSNSSIEDDDGDGLVYDETNSVGLKQYEHDYRTILSHLSVIKKNIVDIESRLNEAMRELEIERALIEGEHELLFKQILDASGDDQQKIQQLYHELQVLIDRIMAEKNAIRNEIDYTQQVLFGLEHELHELEQQYRPSDEKILRQRETIAVTRKKHEDLEFQLMELETRCEAELEEAEQHFQNEQIVVAQNAKQRQNNLRDLDRQQHVILQQVTAEKEKLEREKQRLKLLFKKKKMQASELEHKLNGFSIHENGRRQPKVTWTEGNEIDATRYPSTPPSNIYNALNYLDGAASPKTMTSEDHQEKLNEIKEMIAVAKLEKMTILEQQLRERYSELVQCHGEHIKRLELEQKLADEVKNRDYLVERQVKLREKNRHQERPLTRYLPVRSLDFDLRAHIEAAGHLLDSSHVHLTSTSCRGFLQKMGGMKFKTWNRRWFVFDRKRRSLFYYQDKTETKLRGCVYFQSIVEVYVDHLQSASLRAPEPRGATFIVKTLERPYYLVAPTLEAMRIWVDVIITGAEGNTFAGES